MTQVAFGMAALLLGASVYFFDRAPETFRFAPEGWSGYGAGGLAFGALGGNLPGFTHELGFTLLCAAWFWEWRSAPVVFATFWGILETLFEVAQHEQVAARIAAHVAADPGAGFLARAFVAYCEAGHYDPLDVVAIVAGGVAAVLLASWTQARFQIQPAERVELQ